MNEYKLAITNKSSCIGCRNIASDGFPFSKTGDGLFYIDVENCGEVDKTYDGVDLDGFIIYHCPVCGIYLYEK